MIEFKRFQSKLVFLSILVPFFIGGLIKLSIIIGIFLTLGYLNQWKLRITKFEGSIVIAYLVFIITEIISISIEDFTSDLILIKIVPRHAICLLLVLNYLYLELNEKYEVIKYIVYLVFLSSLISLAQLIGLEWSFSLYDFLYPTSEKVSSSINLEDVVSENLSFYGYPGIFENVVLAAHYYSSLLPCIFLFSFRKIKTLVIFTILFLSIFTLQVRSGLYSSVIILLVYLLLFNTRIFLLILLPSLIYGIWKIIPIIDQINLRVLNSSSDIRIRVNRVFWDYVKEGNFFGKRIYYSQLDSYLESQNVKTPHNIFKNAYVIGGVIGFLATSLIIIKAFLYRIKYVFKDKTTFIIYAAMFNYMVNAITHNNSFIFGDFLFLFLIFTHENKNIIYRPRS